jgi:hypothetical protein
VLPFFRYSLNSGAYIVSKEPNQDPQISKSFYRMRNESFSLSVDLVGSQVEKKKETNVRTTVSAEDSQVRKVCLLNAINIQRVSK